GPAPAEPQGARLRGPPAVLVLRQPPSPIRAETGGRLENDPHLRVAALGHDAAQQHGLVRVAREGQCLAALDDAVLGDPTAAPDQRVVLVVATPDESLLRSDRVRALAADQR